MVADFSDIKRLMKGWIDRELDHKMILRHDDPLVAPLQALGEPIYLLESNPTVERIAKLIFDQGRELGAWTSSGSSGSGIRRRRLRLIHIRSTELPFEAHSPGGPHFLNGSS